MILSSVTKHVKDQNWFAVFVDFIIVVVGVFVGLQVSNWNQQQEDQRTAHEYIDRIQMDLLANQTDMKRRVEYFTIVKNYALATLNKIDQNPETLDSKFLVGAFQASQSLPRRIGRDTYNELLSVGAINTISNLLIRQRLSQYYRSNLTSQSIFINVPTYQDKLRSTMPYDVQKLFRNGVCSNTFSTDKFGAPILTFPKKCNLGLTLEQVKYAVKEIQSANLKPNLIRVLSDLDVKLQIIHVVDDRAKELYQFLENTK